jgi:hypothetical protein
VLRGALPRLEAFLGPFVGAMISPEQRTNARHYVEGLLSELQSKDAESIAYLPELVPPGLCVGDGSRRGWFRSRARRDRCRTPAGRVLGHAIPPARRPLSRR